MTPESTTNSSRKRRGALPITRAEEWLVVALLLLVGYLGYGAALFPAAAVGYDTIGAEVIATLDDRDVDAG